MFGLLDFIFAAAVSEILFVAQNRVKSEFVYKHGQYHGEIARDATPV